MANESSECEIVDMVEAPAARDHPASPWRLSDDYSSSSIGLMEDPETVRVPAVAVSSPASSPSYRPTSPCYGSPSPPAPTIPSHSVDDEAGNPRLYYADDDDDDFQPSLSRVSVQRSAAAAPSAPACAPPGESAVATCAVSPLGKRAKPDDDGGGGGVDLQGISDDLKCAVCQCILRDPRVLVECGHMFCFKCLMGWKQTKGSRFPCPTCRAHGRAHSTHFTRVPLFIEQLVRKVRRQHVESSADGDDDDEHVHDSNKDHHAYAVAAAAASDDEPPPARRRLAFSSPEISPDVSLENRAPVDTRGAHDYLHVLCVECRHRYRITHEMLLCNYCVNAVVEYMQGNREPRAAAGPPVRVAHSRALATIHIYNTSAAADDVAEHAAPSSNPVIVHSAAPAPVARPAPPSRRPAVRHPHLALPPTLGEVQFRFDDLRDWCFGVCRAVKCSLPRETRIDLLFRDVVNPCVQVFLHAYRQAQALAHDYCKNVLCGGVEARVTASLVLRWQESLWTAFTTLLPSFVVRVFVQCYHQQRILASDSLRDLMYRADRPNASMVVSPAELAQAVNAQLDHLRVTVPEVRWFLNVRRLSQAERCNAVSACLPDVHRHTGHSSQRLCSGCSVLHARPQASRYQCTSPHASHGVLPQPLHYNGPKKTALRSLIPGRNALARALTVHPH